jgi:hypothetical protein
MGPGHWFLRAIETTDGWECRHGLLTYDWHPTLPGALDHLAEIAAASQSVEVFVHRRDGTVESAGLYGDSASTISRE